MASTSFDYDLFVIGAGSGGVRASRIASQLGARVGVAEEYRVGGTCVIRGCVPKKLMTYAAHFAEDFVDAAGYGWSVGERRFDWPTFIAAKDHEIDRLNGLYIKTLETNGVTIYPERAVIEDAHTLRVGERIVTADTILVATGGRPQMPATPGIEHAISSNQAFHLERLPDHVVIVGGGYIAVEFAGIFHGMGSQVTLLYRRERILRGFDNDLRRRLQDLMLAKGIDVRCTSDIAAIETGGGGLVARLVSGETLHADTIMYATGRKPNVEGLGLERVGVRTTSGGAIEVDRYSRTSVANIWAVGDVTDRIALTPVAIKEGHAFALTRFGDCPTMPDHEHVASAVFSDPPIGTVGQGEQDARAAGHEIDVYESDFRPMRHTLAGREERAFAKIIVDARTDRVLGMHMIGKDAPEIIQGFAAAIKLGLKKSDLDSTVAIHPTSAEEFVLMRDKRS